MRDLDRTHQPEPLIGLTHLLAGVAAVMFRRHGHGRVRLLYRDLDARRMAPFEVVVDDDLTIGELAQRFTTAWRGAEWEATRSLAAASASDLSAVVDHRVGGSHTLAVDSEELADPRERPTVRWDGTDTSVSAWCSGQRNPTLEAQFARALEAGRHARLGELDLSTARDTERLRALSGLDRVPTSDRCVHELVSAQAARTPDAIAVSAPGCEMTYRQLIGRARDRARRLRDAGVGQGRPVAVLLHRSPDLIVTLLAILEAGGAYLALDLDDPPQRIVQIVTNAQARVAVIDGGLVPHWASDLEVVDLAAERAADALASATSTDPIPTDAATTHPATTHPVSPAYVCYTSGSTGAPRGVVVPHRAVARLVAEPTWIDVRSDDVFLNLAPVSFDASTFEIWAPLVHGARLALFPSGPVDVHEVARHLAQQSVTVLWLTAGLFHTLVATQLPAFAGLRHVLAGGDVVSPGHVNRLLSAHPHLTFSNGYGPTENTTFTTCWTTGSGPTGPRVPIGSAIDGTTVMILDRRQCPVPTGVIGELWTGGAGVALHYLGDPAGTADRFRPDPLSVEPGARRYRTGDLVRWSDDDTLDFLGRIDDQVKIRGYRVEPESVTAELLRLSRVDQACVVVQRSVGGEARLLAYVAAGQVAREEWSEFGQGLRRALQEVLPAYSIPWAILIRSELMLTGNGKVDRRSLPAVTRIPRGLWNEYVMPRTPIEHRLAELWGATLDVEPVGVEDDFFDLGGHSLLAAELLTVVQREFGVRLPARTLYLQPTIVALAEQLAAQGTQAP